MTLDMMDAIIAQIVQPYFYYSFMLLLISLFCVNLLICCGLPLTSRIRSRLSVFPLVVPLIVMAIFTPTLYISLFNMGAHGFLTYIWSGTSAWTATRGPDTASFPLSGQFYHAPYLPQMLSLTGLLCISGLLVSFVFYVMMIRYGDRLAVRALKVVMLTEEDYPELQASIRMMSMDLGIGASSGRSDRGPCTERVHDRY